VTVAPRERATPPRVCCRLRGPGDCGEESWPALHPCRPQASRGTSVVWGCLETTVAELRAGMHQVWQIRGFLWNILEKGGLIVVKEDSAEV